MRPVRRLIRTTLALATCGLALVVPRPGFAQAAPPPPPKQEGTAELAFVGTSGNSSTSTFSAGAQHIARPDGWTIVNRTLLVRGSSDGTVTAESLLYAFRAEHTINARLSAFGDYGYFRDKPAGITMRHTLAGGLALKVVNGARQKLTADAGFGYLNEHRLTGSNVSSATYAAGSHYVLTLSPNADLTDDFRILGTFDQAKDWRLAHSIAVTAKLGSVFSLKASNVLRFANFPPPGFKKTDTTTSVALVAGFKKP